MHKNDETSNLLARRVLYTYHTLCRAEPIGLKRKEPSMKHQNVNRSSRKGFHMPNPQLVRIRTGASRQLALASILLACTAPGQPFPRDPAPTATFVDAAYYRLPEG